MDVSTSDVIPVGKKIFLRPVNPQCIVQQNRNKSAKQQAQELYYRNKYKFTRNHIPVHLRLGGPQRTQFKPRQYYYVDQNFVKPRIRRDRNGFMTPQYQQRAQDRMNFLRKKAEMGKIHPMYITFTTNRKNKYPLLYHSVRGSLNQDVQTAIKVMMEDYVPCNNIDSDVPLHNEDITKISLHQRFSLLP